MKKNDAILSLVYDPIFKNDPRPLPEIVMARLSAPFRFVENSAGKQYVIADWVYAISESSAEDKSSRWRKLKKQMMNDPVLKGVPKWYTLPIETEGGVQELDVTDENGLYFVMQYLPNNSVTIRQVRQFLSDAGVLVDTARRMQDDPEWQQEREASRYARKEFTAALNDALHNVLPRDHGTATDDLYRGLWDRTSAILRRQMGLKRKDSLRDNQPQLGLQYHRIVEGICAKKFAQEADEEGKISRWTARNIVQTVALAISHQARMTSRMLQEDIATGRKFDELEEDEDVLSHSWDSTPLDHKMREEWGDEIEALEDGMNSFDFDLGDGREKTDNHRKEE